MQNASAGFLHHLSQGRADLQPFPQCLDNERNAKLESPDEPDLFGKGIGTLSGGSGGGMRKIRRVANFYVANSRNGAAQPHQLVTVEFICPPEIIDDVGNRVS